MDFPILIIWMHPLSFLGASGVVFSFFDENRVSKQNSPRWDAALCGVTSGDILFAYANKKDARLIWVNFPGSRIKVALLLAIRHHVFLKISKEN